MTDPQHPPIPQGHPRFRTRDGVDEFLEININCCRGENASKVWLMIDRLVGIYRQNCACVARCAWLDEARSVIDDDYVNDDEADLAKNRAQFTADAWREWGERG